MQGPHFLEQECHADVQAPGRRLHGLLPRAQGLARKELEQQGDRRKQVSMSPWICHGARINRRLVDASGIIWLKQSQPSLIHHTLPRDHRGSPAADRRAGIRTGDFEVRQQPGTPNWIALQLLLVFYSTLLLLVLPLPCTTVSTDVC